MIQFNLLPAVKLDYVKAKRTKRITLVISGLTAAVSLGIMLLLVFGVMVFQKNHSQNLTNDIRTESDKLRSIEDLDKILTIQNQLNSLTGLHDSKPVVTRLFNYLSQITPQEVSIASLTVDFETNTMTFSGSANAISSVNKFADTLKFTTYKTADDQEGPAFSGVVLSSFGRDEKGTSYQMSLTFEPKIFSSASEIALQVPAGKITTRSQTEKPTSLFQPLSNPEEEE